MIRAIVHRIRRRYLRSRLGEDGRIKLHPGVLHGEEIFLTGDVNFGSEPFLVRLGSRITIADGVRFITHDGGARIFRAQYPDLHVYAPITIGDDCFIGMASIIMPGVAIGSGSVVGAGSIVTKDIPPGEVWAGIPARRIKSANEYRESLVARNFSWPVGEYGEMWQRTLMDLYPVESSAVRGKGDPPPEYEPR